jgi:uncharacterized membrane protein
MHAIKGMMLGLAVGAGSMYLLDPRRGARRRHGLVDRARRAITDVEDVAGKARRDAENRAHGLSARLHGSPPSHRERTMLSESTPERRLLEGGGGAALALYGLVRGGALGLLASIGGVSLIARAVVPRMRGMIRVQKTITINAPIDEVFAFWSRFENFPRFMEHVIEVATDGPRSHWRVKGPAGLPIAWDADLVESVPNRKIAWRSVEGSVVVHNGEVHFESLGDRTTRINIHMAYKPPACAIGHAVAAFLVGDPKKLIDDDLMRMKSLLEGNPPRDSRMRATELH